MYKCRECGATFEEPHRWEERHGFDYGPFEKWSACPCCGDCDYDEEYVVDREQELEDEEDTDDCED